MNPINITMETYMQVSQKMLKINNYLWTQMCDLDVGIVMDVKKTNYQTYMRVLQWIYKKSVTTYKNYIRVL